MLLSRFASAFASVSVSACFVMNGGCNIIVVAFLLVCIDVLHDILEAKQIQVSPFGTTAAYTALALQVYML